MAKRRGQSVHGWVNLDKPKGISSAKAVAIVRRVFDAAKAGHGGTLDPLASGILPIALGEATKTVGFAMGRLKTYEFTIAWGSETSSDDAEGEVTRQSENRPDDSAIDAALAGFIGEIDQVPPTYSAIKVDGKRAYDFARKAGSLDVGPQLKPRKILINALDVLDLGWITLGFTSLAVKVRTLGFGARSWRDLGTAAHVTNLRRLSVGNFHANDAISLDFLETLPHSAAALKHLHPVVSALDDIPALPISENEAVKLRHGQTLPALGLSAQKHFMALKAGETAIAMFGDMPVASVALKEGVVCPVRVLNL